MGIWENVEGNDVAGYVEAVGEGVTKFKKGDKVAAFTKMITDQKFGAYAEYTVSCSLAERASNLSRNTLGCRMFYRLSFTATDPNSNSLTRSLPQSPLSTFHRRFLSRKQPPFLSHTLLPSLAYTFDLDFLNPARLFPKTPKRS
jgi:hypothetical protein